MITLTITDHKVASKWKCLYTYLHNCHNQVAECVKLLAGDDSLYFWQYLQFFRCVYSLYYRYCQNSFFFHYSLSFRVRFNSTAFDVIWWSMNAIFIQCFKTSSLSQKIHLLSSEIEMCKLCPATFFSISYIVFELKAGYNILAWRVWTYFYSIACYPALIF